MAVADALLNAINSLKQLINSQPPQDRKLEIEEDHTKELFAALDTLGAIEVVVGIPEANDSRGDGSQIGNAQLAYIQETGSPLNNIPPRPFLSPGVSESADQWMSQLRNAGEAALNFKQDEMMQAFSRAGIIASDAVKLKIQAGIAPPLKGPRYHKGRAPQPPSEATPLIDTGSLLRSITYSVEKKAGG
jgi:hypothetical protein